MVNALFFNSSKNLEMKKSSKKKKMKVKNLGKWQSATLCHTCRIHAIGTDYISLSSTWLTISTKVTGAAANSRHCHLLTLFYLLGIGRMIYVQTSQCQVEEEAVFSASHQVFRNYKNVPQYRCYRKREASKGRQKIVYLF